MIRSMVSKMIRSMITTVINPFDGLISRYFVTLDPVLNSSYELAAPITFTGDFEIEVEFSTTSFDGAMITSTLNSAEDYIFVRSGTSGSVGLGIDGAFFNGGILVADGKLHTIKVTRVGTTVSLFVDGVFDGTGTSTSSAASFGLLGAWSEGTFYFDGIIANAKFTDKSGASDVVTTFKLDNSPAAENYIYSTELLDNNTFTNGTTDWYSSRGVSSLSIVNNKLVSTADSTLIFGAAQQVDNLIIGNVYKIVGTATCSNSSAEVYIRASTNSDLSGNSPSQDFSANATGTVTANSTFTATATTLSVGVIVSGHAANDTVTIDAGITVKEITNYTEANAASEIEYSQENVFGAEEVVNGDFATDSDWTLSNQVSIANGVLNIQSNDGSYQSAAQIMTGAQIGKVYEATFNITRVGDTGIIKVSWVGDASATANAKIPSTIGIHKVIWPHNGTSNLMSIGRNSGSQTTDIDISEFSLKEITNAVEYKNIPQTARELYSLEDDTWVGSNELVVNGDFATDLSGWTVPNSGGWTWDNGSAKLDGDGSLQPLYQNNLFEIGKSYEVTVFVSNLVGSLVVVLGGTGNSSLVSGTNTIIFTSLNVGLEFKRGGGVTAANIDNVSVKEIIEVAEQAAFSPVTAPMTLTEAWTTRGTSYSTLSVATSASVRVDATISNTDDGILMESGGSGAGVILYVYSGVLYFQCGRGEAYGTDNDRAEVSYTLPVGESDYIIEWSADTSKAVLYVDGLLVGSQTFSNTNLSGTDYGTLGEVQSTVPVNRGGWTTDGSGLYTNTITKCDIFNYQITSDV